MGGGVPKVDLHRIATASAQYIKPASFQAAYGTAGFRAEASLLSSTVFRCGLLTAARSLLLGSTCGLMITASHNPEPDNGVKIVEPDGGMLVAGWEPLATEIASSSDDQEVAAMVERLLRSHGQAQERPWPGCVVLGCDTRPSAPTLVAAAKAGVEALGASVIDLGEVTTPQLHFQVVAINEDAAADPSWQPTVPSLDRYFSTLIGGFTELVGTAESAIPTTIHVDCANGVGSAQLAAAADKLASSGLQLQLINTSGRLNHKCGADFVQKEVVAPSGFDAIPADARCCSIDGDADRLVYFTLQPADPSGDAARRVTLYDGDKIAALAASLLKDLVAGLPADISSNIKMGVVQTAYANGASTDYLESSLGLQVVCTKTGVKHLHPAAHAFDIGIYFEANGHGTVLMAPKLLNTLKQIEAGSAAARQLLSVSRAVNQAVGDALSGVLLVEATLRLKRWTMQDWAQLYTDLPSKQRKLVVKDRGVLVSGDEAERRVCAPAGLQEAIDQLVAAAGSKARAFVRASGTEDAVRVYAEASTQAAADELALQVAQAVHKLAGGVGPAPTV